MKSFTFVLLIAQAALLQTTYGQCLRSYAPNLLAPCAPQVQTVLSAPLVPANSVANSLADTLSLLTVSSLLSNTLPLGYTDVVGVPALSVGGCGCGVPALPIGGCGCGCGYNNIFY